MYICNQIHFASILNCYQRTDIAKVCVVFIWLQNSHWLTLLGGRKMFFRETVYSWILCNMARYYYRNILLTSAAYLTKTYIRRVKYVYISYMFILFHKHAISPVHLNRGWIFLIKDMFKHIDRNHKFAFYLSCENSHDTLQKYWDA